MRKFLLSTILILTSFLGFGQCPDQQINLFVQEQIDNFVADYPNCTELMRTLLIGHPTFITDITNLNGLSGITAVGISANAGLSRNLAIVNTIITDFSGLENLEYIGGNLAVKNTNVINLTGFSSLLTIEGGLLFQQNEFLVNMEGLPAAVLLGGDLGGDLYYFDNPALVNFQGLNIIDEALPLKEKFPYKVV